MFDGPRTQIECSIPVLPVRNLVRSREFYLQRLGFVLDWGGELESQICSVSRDGHCIMLRQQREGNVSPAWVWIGAENDRIFEEWRQQEVSVLQEPKNFSWAYEMKFLDLDGNVLWVGTEPRTDEPLVDCGRLSE